jgi:LAO/AO transport system kinase
MDPESSPLDLANAVLSGKRLELSRLLTEVENETPTGQAALDRLFPFTGKAHIIGVTGSPGVGKSSLVNQLVRHLRHAEPQLKIAVLAVDPTSPFTGGAVLGDRLRMRDLSGDAGVFIRSMASRGALGGIAAATSALAQVFDAAGYASIFIETVGAGQAEVEIARLAHTTIVVDAPGLGDDVQAIKAGILEVADILVVNKADQPGSESAVRTLKSMVEMGAANGYRNPGAHNWMADGGVLPGQQKDAYPAWTPPVLAAVSTRPDGIGAVAAAIADHRSYLMRSGEWQKRDRERLRAGLIQRLQSELLANWQSSHADDLLETSVEALSRRTSTPREVIKRLMEQGPDPDREAASKGNVRRS